MSDLTREEIMEMEGRELDVVVSQRVFGAEVRATVGEIRYRRDGIGATLPRYSTDISAAWEVVELLDKHGIVRISNGDGDSRDCAFMPYIPAPYGEYSFASVSIEGGSFPEAICRAALIATLDKTMEDSNE